MLDNCGYRGKEYEMFIAFTRQNWILERALLLRLYVHCLSCYLYTSFSFDVKGRRSDEKTVQCESRSTECENP